jgi:hypothetical protein
LLLWMSGLWLVAARFAWKGIAAGRPATTRSLGTSTAA